MLEPCLLSAMLTISIPETLSTCVYDGKLNRHDSGEEITQFPLKTDVILDEVRAGGRIPLIIGRGLTQKAREHLGLGPSTVFRSPVDGQQSDRGYTLAQKMVGKSLWDEESDRAVTANLK